MEVVYWMVIGILVVALLFGIKDWFFFFMGSWHDNGAGFTIRAIILFVLIFVPAITRDYAPKYYGLAVWALIIYSLALFLQRFITNKHKEG